PMSVIVEHEVVAPAKAWIFTSATLAVNGDFRHYRSEMGLEWADAACWESPFDYAHQAVLYVPSGLPAPNQSAHTDAVIAAALPVLKASGGGALRVVATHPR